MAKVTIKKSTTIPKSAKPERKIAGKTWGLNLRQTWVKLFEENAKNKQTDEQLHKFMKAEFPDRKSKDITVPEMIGKLRRVVNSGAFTNGEKPAVPFVRYNENKEVITVRGKLVKEGGAPKKATPKSGSGSKNRSSGSKARSVKRTSSKAR